MLQNSIETVEVLGSLAQEPSAAKRFARRFSRTSGPSNPGCRPR